MQQHKPCKKCVKIFQQKVQEMIDHRGGMGTRIDAWDILDMLKNKHHYINIKD